MKTRGNKSMIYEFIAESKELFLLKDLMRNRIIF